MFPERYKQSYTVLISNETNIKYKLESFGKFNNIIYPHFVKNPINDSSFKYVNILSLNNQIQKVICGYNFSVCLTKDGRLRSWGSNYYLCLGVSNKEFSRVLIEISADHFKRSAKDSKPVRVTDISCGMKHCLALTEDGGADLGRVFSWGKGDKGVLGIEDQTTLSVPTQIPSLSFKRQRVSQISSGLHHNAVLTEKHKVFTFGMGLNGRLGNFSDSNQHVPCEVAGLEQVAIRSVNCGNDATVCIDMQNQLWAFGFNNKGKLGAFSIDSKISEPICILQVPNKYQVEGVQEVSVGFTHSTIRTVDNKIFLLGDLSVTKPKGVSGEGKYHPRRLDSVNVADNRR